MVGDGALRDCRKGPALVTPHDIEITWLSNTVRFGPDKSPVVVGRSSASSVMIPDGVVSRRHLVLSWNQGRWEVEDVSTHGTYDPIGVRLARTWVVGTDGSVQLGSSSGTEVRFRLVTADAPPLNEEDASGPRTVVDYSPPPRPRSTDGGMKAIPDQSIDDGPRFVRHVMAGGPSEPEPQPALVGMDAAAVADDPAGAIGGEPESDLAVVEARSDEVVRGDSSGGLLLGEALAPDVDSEAADPPRMFDFGIEPSEGSLDLREPKPVIDLAGGPAPADPPPPMAGHQAPAANPAETFVEAATLRLHIDGEDYLFLPGPEEISVGRDPACTVVVEEHHTLVSRKHLRIVHQRDSWWFEDASSKGSFVDGRALSGPYKAEGAFVVELGDRIGGTPLRVVTAGEHRAPRNIATMAVAGIAGAALILVSFLAWLTFRGDAGEAATLDEAKKSTVMLLATNGRGSGFFVSDSLILTNQHVADLADNLVVAVSEEADEPAQIRYLAQTVEIHPFLDLALLRVTNSAQINDEGTVDIGGPVDSVDVPTLGIGSSDEVTLGDPIFSTGFPGRLGVSSTDDSGRIRLSPVSTSRGEAASFTIWPGCSNPDFESFIPVDAPEGVTCDPDGDVNRGLLIASFASGEGASGSPVVHEGNVVAVVFAGDPAQPNVSRSITTDAFSDWLDEVLADNG